MANDPFRVGHREYGDERNNFFNGLIDEVRYYNRALSEEEIQELYQLGKPNQHIEEIIDFFDDSADKGQITGTGPNSIAAENRLCTFGNRLDDSKALLYIEDKEGACVQLSDAFNKVDGVEPPPDFLDGMARQELADMLQSFMSELYCL